MLSNCNIAIAKIPCHSRVMAFSNKIIPFVLFPLVKLVEQFFNWQQQVVQIAVNAAPGIDDPW